jgi:hypothetical protein
MAETNFIATAQNELEEALMQLRSLIKMCDELAPADEPPEWLFVVGKYVTAVTEKSEALFTLLNNN